MSPLLDQLMKLEAEQEERRTELAELLVKQGQRQSTPEERERQQLMKDNLLRLEELRFDQMILTKQRAQQQQQQAAQLKELILPFKNYYQTHILTRDLALQMPRLYEDFPCQSVCFREAAQAAMQVCQPLRLREEDTDSSAVGLSSAVSGSRGARPSREGRLSSRREASSVGVSARSSNSTAPTMEGHRISRPSVPKLLLPKRLEGSEARLDSRQRKTRDALEKLTQVYSVPISRSAPCLVNANKSQLRGPEREKTEEKRPPRPPLPLPPKERLPVKRSHREAVRVRSEHALEREAHQRRPQEAKLQPLNPKSKAYGPSLRDELRVRDELGKLLSCEMK